MGDPPSIPTPKTNHYLPRFLQKKSCNTYGVRKRISVPLRLPEETETTWWGRTPP
jgi:hypothetical protein